MIDYVPTEIIEYSEVSPYDGYEVSDSPSETVTTPSADENYGVSWLYNLGLRIADSASFVGDVLSFKIGNSDLLSLLFTSGFLVYMGWCVVKWVIPS